MERLKKDKMERFARLIAFEDCDVAEACYRAGYGAENHPQKDTYHINMGSRLLKREDVQLRIHTLREQLSNSEKDYKATLIDNLKKIVAFDTGQYLKSSNVTLQNGRIVTDFYFSRPIEDWNEQDRRLMLNGFDNYGRPKFMDKQWAYEKLIKLLFGEDKQQDIEDLINLFNNANLPMTPPSDALSSSEIKEIEEETKEDK